MNSSSGETKDLLRISPDTLLLAHMEEREIEREREGERERDTIIRIRSDLYLYDII
jgi:hypothetical protein